MAGSLDSGDFRSLFASLKFAQPGARARIDAPAGATDALALTALAQKARVESRLLFIICADPSEIGRLADEITWLDPTLQCVTFPDWETLPYDTMSPHADLVSERVQTLWRLTQGSGEDAVNVLIASAVTAAQRISPKSFVASRTFFFRPGQKIDITTLTAHLVSAGYGRVESVMAPGEFAVRGGILDLWPMGVAEPIRLDMFDDEIDALRRFDPDTQRSTDTVPSIRVLPGHEFPFDQDAREAFRRRWRETFTGDPNKAPVYCDVGNGVTAGGIEYYLPLFFDQTETLIDYLPTGSAVVTVGDADAALSAFLTETSERSRFLAHDATHPALPAEALFCPNTEFFTRLSTHGRMTLSCGTAFEGDVQINRKAKDPTAKLKARLDSERVQKRRVLILTSSAGRQARLNELLRTSQDLPEAADFAAFLRADNPLMTAVGPLSAGLNLAAPAITVITETELYDIRTPLRRNRIKSRASNVEAMIRDISELREGDAVVHVEHGVGRYRGLKTMATGEGEAEFVQIDYAGDAKLFVPVAQLHLISCYTGGDAEHAPMHTLGRGDWEKAKRKAAQKARDTAAELLNLYALRQSRPGFAYEGFPSEYEAFCEGFAFEETPDQAQAIQAVMADMHSAKPMDRLVCGDVGFGKTEVALRAAFVAVMNGKQVAVLCPTTLLAEQHTQTFRDRFAAWPVRIAELSRFRSGKQTAEAVAGLADGAVDIVIGTHKLLSESVQFKRLGLVVIDEEHRFGVRQKERLKSLRSEVDVLTLTATPIPRTLAMSLDGIRDFSVIATAPQKRLAIKTFVRRETKELIREAIMRELKRGGQVYFLHNDVDTIHHRAEMLAELVPEARITVAHGQMPERELERVMRDFYRGSFNVLVCTTIIETGIDIPVANTIIMHRADKFGLAQLHQLRGRVGRSHHQAYAYLLTPDAGSITKNAERRLEAIQNLEELGSGFYLSMHDLEIRGAGEVLGDEQSGEMAQVGFDLYAQMLKSAVEALKRGVDPALENPFSTLAEINLHMPALLPEDYVGDVGCRLGIYKRLAAAQTRGEIEDVVDDLVDRFGKLPEAARALIQTHRLRLACSETGITKIDAADEAVVFSFLAKPRFDPMALISLLQSRTDVRMLGPSKLKLTIRSEGLVKRMNVVSIVLDPLLQSVSAHDAGDTKRSQTHS